MHGSDWVTGQHASKQENIKSSVVGWESGMTPFTLTLCKAYTSKQAGGYRHARQWSLLCCYLRQVLECGSWLGVCWQSREGGSMPGSHRLARLLSGQPVGGLPSGWWGQGSPLVHL